MELAIMFESVIMIAKCFAVVLGSSTVLAAGFAAIGLFIWIVLFAANWLIRIGSYQYTTTRETIQALWTGVPVPEKGRKVKA